MSIHREPEARRAPWRACCDVCGALAMREDGAPLASDLVAYLRAELALLGWTSVVLRERLSPLGNPVDVDVCSACSGVESWRRRALAAEARLRELEGATGARDSEAHAPTATGDRAAFSASPAVDGVRSPLVQRTPQDDAGGRT